eukprot:Blabericola_migrator_1__2123@NODE_1587_length_4224_cov_18_054607_g1037_i0_p3_GENE_NODE_1587_length_4224_cov_18_054607_g1037_i0NODE_1587_length_4224_cov_18_054607_g1037_i0_p3_ORF_typecomplete_len364_score63_82_NODE_1587_length_4224_cov_18_054607_g1037_i015392630
MRLLPICFYLHVSLFAEGLRAKKTKPSMLGPLASVSSDLSKDLKARIATITSHDESFKASFDAAVGAPIKGFSWEQYYDHYRVLLATGLYLCETTNSKQSLDKLGRRDKDAYVKRRIQHQEQCKAWDSQSQATVPEATDAAAAIVDLWKSIDAETPWEKKLGEFAFFDAVQRIPSAAPTSKGTAELTDITPLIAGDTYGQNILKTIKTYRKYTTERIALIGALCKRLEESEAEQCDVITRVAEWAYDNKQQGFLPSLYREIKLAYEASANRYVAKHGGRLPLTDMEKDFGSSLKDIKAEVARKLRTKSFLATLPIWTQDLAPRIIKEVEKGGAKGGSLLSRILESDVCSLDLEFWITKSLLAG